MPWIPWIAETHLMCDRSAPLDVQHTLVNAIATIRDVVTRAAEGDDPWVLSASTIDIPLLSPGPEASRLGPTANFSNELTHTLRLGLAPGPA